MVVIENLPSWKKQIIWCLKLEVTQNRNCRQYFWFIGNEASVKSRVQQNVCAKSAHAKAWGRKKSSWLCGSIFFKSSCGNPCWYSCLGNYHRDHDPFLSLTGSKSINPVVYEVVGEVFLNRFSFKAGREHSVVFAAELPEFIQILPVDLLNEWKYLQKKRYQSREQRAL